MAQLKLILLDFDGTLANTRIANARAYIAALSERGIALNEEEYYAKHFGMRCMEFLASLGITDNEMAKSIRQRKVELYPNYFESITLNRPLWEWCQKMRKGGVKVWIVSTGHIDNICNVMRFLHIENSVDGILSGDDIEHPKPAPDCFLKAMHIVGVTPTESIIFEDSPMGIAAAKSSGAHYAIVKLD